MIPVKLDWIYQTYRHLLPGIQTIHCSFSINLQILSISRTHHNVDTMQSCWNQLDTWHLLVRESRVFHDVSNQCIDIYFHGFQNRMILSIQYDMTWKDFDMNCIAISQLPKYCMMTFISYDMIIMYDMICWAKVKKGAMQRDREKRESLIKNLVFPSSSVVNEALFGFHVSSVTSPKYLATNLSRKLSFCLLHGSRPPRSLSLGSNKLEVYCQSSDDIARAAIVSFLFTSLSFS